MTPAPAPQRILFVDDDPNLLAALQRNLRKNYTFDTALGGREALQTIQTKGPYAVIVSDMSMPGMNGVELLEQVQRVAPDTVRLMLTGNADQQSAVAAVNRGQVHRFLNKPCPPEQLIPALDDALKEHRVALAEKTLLDETLNGALKVLTDILAGLDAEAFGQAQIRRAAVRETARQMGVAETWDLEIAAQLADLGRVTLPGPLREKIRAGHLMTSNERQLVERVPEFSSRLLGSIPRLEQVAQIVLFQDKQFDGEGFPAEDRSGAALPLGARILHAVNGLIAMHQGGMPADDAVMTIKANPKRYDPAVAQSIGGCAALLRTTAKPAASGPRRLKLAELTPGYVLVSDIVTLDGVMVLAAGMLLEAVHLQRVRNFAALNPIAEPITVDAPPHAPA